MQSAKSPLVLTSDAVERLRLQHPTLGFPIQYAGPGTPPYCNPTPPSSRISALNAFPEQTKEVAPRIYLPLPVVGVNSVMRQDARR